MRSKVSWSLRLGVGVVATRGRWAVGDRSFVL